jgi:hypothetical protein
MTSSVILNTMGISVSNAQLLISQNITRLTSGTPRLVAALTFGLILALVGLLIVHEDMKTLGNPAVRGSVVASSTAYDRNGNPLYTPTVRYVVNGKPYTVLSGYSGRDRLKMGEPRTVSYSADEPALGTVRRSGMALAPYALLVFGAGLMIAALAGLMYHVYRGRPRAST